MSETEQQLGGLKQCATRGCAVLLGANERRDICIRCLGAEKIRGKKPR